MVADKTRLPDTGNKALSSQSQVDAFLQRIAATPKPVPQGGRGRLIFAMDATASRQPSWDSACRIQGEMFRETAALGGLDIQLAYYRGFHEFDASPWLSDAETLLGRMTAVQCRGGQTQIDRLLHHAMTESRQRKVQALVFVGDCFEEDIDRVCQTAGALGLLGVPAFLFHEGGEPAARRAFEEIARLTKGAYCPFDASSAQQLRDLLSAVAVYAAGGYRALESYGKRKGGAALMLTSRLGRA